MTTRDSRSSVPARPDDGRESVRDPTASLSIELDSAAMESVESVHPSLAVGTSDAAREQTKIESPGGRNKTPAPASPAGRPPIPGKSADDPDNRLGSVLGTYKLVELLGKGGMGYVYRAEHTKLGREVALKLLRGDYAKRRDAVLRFFQEAKTVNRVRHRNIVDVTDFVELPDGTTFIIMELLRGQSLGRWARSNVDLPRALAVLVQMCDGLGAAHAVGVVHRDLKPDNVVVVPTSDGAEMVKLLDFGVAKLLNRDDEDFGFQTAAGSVIGTPAYMSPEQAGGMAVDHRSDIYSLGAIMYELFCGQPMFRGRSFGEYVRKHLTERPVPPRQTPKGSGLDERLEELILKCLEKEPSARFSHILELRDGLLHLLGGIETQTGNHVLSQSGIRAAPTAIAPQALPPHLLPLPDQGMALPMPTPASAGYAHPSDAHHLSTPYSQYNLLASASHQVDPPTPWWVWLGGGVIAIGLGIAGALWYAGTGDDPADGTPSQPTAAPIDPAVEPGARKLVELRFDSLPSGGVYADGRSVELCRTPCNFNVDLSDGGPADRRTFVLRADGYEDRRVEVDFRVSQRDFSVTLTRLAPTVPASGTATGEAPGSDEIDLSGASTPPEEDATTRRSGTKKPGKKHGAGDRPPRSDLKPSEAATPEPSRPEPKPAEVKTDVKTESRKPEPNTTPGKIDPADTIDPFSRTKK